MSSTAPIRAIVCLMLAAPCAGQGLGEIREAFRDSLRAVAFAQSFAGLALAADDLELAGAQYDAGDAELTVLNLPFATTLRPSEAATAGLYLEGVLGYAQSNERAPDIYQGVLPGLETAVDADWTTYSALGGLGVELTVTPGLTLTPIVDVGVARIESDATYAGPGAALSRVLLDGIAFNWEAWAFIYGGAARVEWTHDLTPDHRLDVTGRYDLRWNDSFDEDDPAQEFTARVQAMTIRTDLVGPTGVTLWGGALRWRATVGYRRFLEGDFSGADDFVRIGGALELGEVLPLGSKLALSAAAILGDDIDGWALGLGLSF